MPAPSVKAVSAESVLKILAASVIMETPPSRDEVYISKDIVLLVWFTQGFLSNIPKPNYFLV